MYVFIYEFLGKSLLRNEYSRLEDEIFMNRVCVRCGFLQNVIIFVPRFFFN